MLSDFPNFGWSISVQILSDKLWGGSVRLEIALICHAGVQISKFWAYVQKSSPEVDPIFKAFFDNYIFKNSPRKSAIGPNFFGTGHDRLDIPERKARLT